MPTVPPFAVSWRRAAGSVAERVAFIGLGVTGAPMTGCAVAIARGGGVRAWVLGRRDEGDTPSSRTLTLPFTCGGRGTPGREARRQVEWSCSASYSSPNRSTRIILFRRSGRAATRSYARIEGGDLEHLAALACQDREQFFSRRPRWGTLYADRMICVALCQ